MHNQGRKWTVALICVLVTVKRLNYFIVRYSFTVTFFKFCFYEVKALKLFHTLAYKSIALVIA